jgi:hypothetical protein
MRQCVPPLRGRLLIRGLSNPRLKRKRASSRHTVAVSLLVRPLGHPAARDALQSTAPIREAGCTVELYERPPKPRVRLRAGPARGSNSAAATPLYWPLAFPFLRLSTLDRAANESTPSSFSENPRR